MSREQECIKRKLEKNAFVECDRIQNKFCPELFDHFEKVVDPHHASYIEYTNKAMLGTVYFKGIAGLVSMQSMTYELTTMRWQVVLQGL